MATQDGGPDELFLSYNGFLSFLLDLRHLVKCVRVISLIPCMMSTPNFRSNHAIRQAILNHRSRNELDTIMALQESINFHRSLLYLRPTDFSNSSLVSLQDNQPINELACLSDEEKEQQMKAAETERSTQRKLVIKELRKELAHLKRSVDKKNKSERAKIVSSESFTNSYAQASISEESRADFLAEQEHTEPTR